MNKSHNTDGLLEAVYCRTLTVVELKCQPSEGPESKAMVAWDDKNTHMFAKWEPQHSL